MNRPLSPKSVPYAAMAYLKRQPVGTEISSDDLAKVVGKPAIEFTARFSAIMKAGLLQRRIASKAPLPGRHSVWSLGPEAVNWEPLSIKAETAARWSKPANTAVVFAKPNVARVTGTGRNEQGKIVNSVWSLAL